MELRSFFSRTCHPPTIQPSGDEDDDHRHVPFERQSSNNIDCTLWIILQLSFSQEETANIATEVIFTKGSASKIKIPIFYQESKKKAKQ